jgi:hypothetical protein
MMNNREVQKNEEQRDNSSAEQANQDVSSSANNKNPETSVNSLRFFDDDYEFEQEDKLSSNEARSEKAKRSGS